MHSLFFQVMSATLASHAMWRHPAWIVGGGHEVSVVPLAIRWGLHVDECCMALDRMQGRSAHEHKWGFASASDAQRVLASGFRGLLGRALAIRIFCVAAYLVWVVCVYVCCCCVVRQPLPCGVEICRSVLLFRVVRPAASRTVVPAEARGRRKLASPQKSAPEIRRGGVARKSVRIRPRRSRMWTRVGDVSGPEFAVLSGSGPSAMPLGRMRSGPRNPHEKAPVLPMIVQIRAK